MKKYDSIIFDVDGTLWNASLASARGWNKGLGILGLDQRVSARQIESVAGLPFERCVDMLLPGLRQENASLVRVLDYYEREAVEELGGIFYKEALEGLRELSGSYRVFIVSNCQEWYLKTFFAYSSVQQHLTDFDCNGMSGKPKHDMIRAMIKKHGLKKPVYIGDTHMDKKAARRAGVAFRYAAYGFGHNFSFNTFSDIVKYFHARRKQKQRNDRSYQITEYI